MYMQADIFSAQQLLIPVNDCRFHWTLEASFHKAVSSQGSEQKEKQSIDGGVTPEESNMSIISYFKDKNPTKREVHSCYSNFCYSHKGYLQLNFAHNHPLHSAHVLSFRPVFAETKEKYAKLFSAEHSPASAHHYYENTLMDEYSDELQEKLADRAINPTVQDVNRLYQK